MSHTKVSKSPRKHNSFREYFTQGPKTESSPFLSFNEVINEAQPGDLIEIERSGTNHYVLYLNNGNVMNVEASASMGNTVIEAQVVERSLEEACNGSKARVRNLDKLAASKFNAVPKSSEEIVRSAKFYRNKSVCYQSHERNCEYYCTLWRYGVGFSKQAANASSTMLGPLLRGMGNQDGYAKYKLLAHTPSGFLNSSTQFEKDPNA